MLYLNSLKNSFIAIKKYPKLFVPKMFLAIIWGLLLLGLAGFSLKLMEFQLKLSQGIPLMKVSEFFFELIFLVILFVIIFLIDVFINAIYPFLINAFYKKQKISLMQGIKYVSKNLYSFLSPIILSIIIAVIVLTPFVFLFSFFLLVQNIFAVIVLGIVLIAIIFLVSAVFYFVAPIAVLEKKGLKSLIESFKALKRNSKPVSFGVIIAFILSLATLVLAFIIQGIPVLSFIGITAFIILRIITACLATYQIVLNPVLYLEFEKKQHLVLK